MTTICHKILTTRPQDIVQWGHQWPEPKLGDAGFGVTRYDPQMFLTAQWAEILRPLGRLSALLFDMQPAADKGNIHVDLDSRTQEPFWPSLNVILKGQGQMKWFAPQTPGTVKFHDKAQVYYKYWDRDFGPVIDCWDQGRVALVRTDIPHNAWNHDQDLRRVISVRWSNHMSWADTVDYFKQWLTN